MKKVCITDVLNMIVERDRRRGTRGGAHSVQQVDELQSIIVSTINGVYPSLQEAINIRYKKIKAEVDELKPIRIPFSSGVEDEMLKAMEKDW
jgi:hypothetical protein